MFQGAVTRMSEAVVASADKIYAKADIMRVTGSTTINTIYPGLGSSLGQMLVLIPENGAITLGTTGNILVGIAAAQNRAVFLVFNKTSAKWYINSGV